MHSVGIVLSFDSNMFQQGINSILSIKKYCTHPNYKINVLAIDLKNEEMIWLSNNGVNFVTNYQDLPSHPEQKKYNYSQTCRAFLPEIFPGFDIYMWVDADIRFLNSQGLDYFCNIPMQNTDSIAIVHEAESDYGFVKNIYLTYNYHTLKNERIAKVYGVDAEKVIRYFYYYNNGIWSMHKNSKIWSQFKLAILQYLKQNYFHHMFDQEAMNMAILGLRIPVIYTPSTMNWLFGAALPLRDNLSNNWITPSEPHRQISVAHLIMSNAYADQENKLTWYDLYKKMGIE